MAQPLPRSFRMLEYTTRYSLGTVMNRLVCDVYATAVR